ncbi:hypothetical protein G7Z17_g2913 [Cylindrodendrum hubeiense]|uniref:Arrestin-like N-terminal domain-containing protein n=1 Tax=Cylindrodendrum hubeiense TaxID=595255 RepID=A0A9P5HGV4_9HYPO|nr:hypothetical protein G7Z17_g2913 [Cylindrodendrum hubeiense]
MPQTSLRSSGILGIRLQHGQISYAPGDTITGCVFRTSKTVSPKASVTISLHGRTKSLTSESRGMGASVTYRGRFNLVNSSRSKQRIFHGPLHIPNAGQEQAWPFAITIPTHVDHTTLGSTPRDQSYLPLDSGDFATRPLPSTFTLNHNGFTCDLEGFVEYFLKAELRLIEKGSEVVVDAILPFNVVVLNPGPPIVDFKTKAFRGSCVVSSYRLVPGNEDAQLSFSQKTKQLFATTNVPKFGLTLHIDFPTVIQLENLNPVPFLIRLAPDWHRTSQDVQGIPQKARLTRLSMKIVAATEIRCEGTFSPHHEDTKMQSDLDIASAIGHLGRDIYIPCTEESPPVNVGEMINLRIGYHGRLGQRYSHEALGPSFKTYNIRQSHSLNWAISLEMAGQSFKVSSSTPLTILPPSDNRVHAANAQGSGHSQYASTKVTPLQTSESWIQPPEEEKAPPSFSQVQEEDKNWKEYEDGDVKKA